MSLTNYLDLPGMGTPTLSSENVATWGQESIKLTKSIVVSSTTVDARNTPTTHLTPGLLLGKITATGEYAHYSPTAVDGTQFAEGMLISSVNMLTYSSGTAQDKNVHLLVAGAVKASAVGGLDQLARSQLFGRFIFDDDLIGNTAGWRNVVAKATSYTVLAADNNTLFTTQGAVGAVTFTLPTIAKGLRYRFFNEAAQTMTIASVVADTLVVFNDLAADSISFSTASELIGNGIEVIANADATKWLVWVNLGAETVTPTIAT